MKKFTILFLILLCLLFNMTTITSLAATNNFKEGFYKVSSFNLPLNKTFSIQNISQADDVYVLIFDSNNVVQQSLRLAPKSEKFVLPTLKPDFSFVIVGKGTVSIS